MRNSDENMGRVEDMIRVARGFEYAWNCSIPDLTLLKIKVNVKIVSETLVFIAVIDVFFRETKYACEKTNELGSNESRSRGRREQPETSND
jgi:hypothetical protein